MTSAITSLQQGQSRRHVFGRGEVGYDYGQNVRQAWASAAEGRDVNKIRKVQVTKRKGWKTVRIFVSSTFLDFHAERECLVKIVFPQLRSWCEQRRIHLIDCDLRWGVPKDSTTETTMRMCLSEIDRCRNDNLYPFFLNMTSERCGWVPVEDEVPEGIRQEYSWVFGMSVTEMEILHSSYRTENPNALFMLRESAFLDDIPEDKHCHFIETHAAAQQKLRALKRQIISVFPKDRVEHYSCKYDGIDSVSGLVKLSGLDDFSDKVYRFFKAKIEEQYPLEEVEMDEYSHQREMHTAFMENRAASLIGRTDILQSVQDYVTSDETRTPFVILGGPGLGKSSIMAKIADVYTKKAARQELPGDTEWNVFCHFVGATPGSTDAQLMLKRLLKELKICTDLNMPSTWDMLTQTVFSGLDNENTPPAVVVIDAVNQLDNADDESVFSWLPQKHAKNIKIVMSMINESSTHKILQRRENDSAVLENPVPPLDMKVREEIVRELFQKYNKLLPEEHMALLLAKKASENPLWLSVACEELRVFGQFRLIGEKIEGLEDDLLGLLGQVLKRFEVEFGGRLLVATLCLLECSRHGLLESELLRLLAEEGHLFPAEYDTRFVDSDEEDEEGDDVQATQGDEGEVTVTELGQGDAPLEATKKAVAATQGTDRIPYIKWSKVYHALRVYLRPFGESGEGRLDFYHRSLSKTVRKAYFRKADGSEDQDMYKWWHEKLANFFEKDTNVARKVEEYPYQLRHLGDKDRLKTCLLDWDITDRLYNEEYSSELLGYWRFAVASFEQIKDEYKKKLHNLISSLDDSVEAREVIALRNEIVGRILLQAGKYADAKGLIETAMHYEKEELGARPERMAALHESLVMVWDGITKLHGYYSRDQIHEVRPLIENARQAIKIRKTLTGRQNKYKLGFDYVTLAFHMKGWTYLGGTDWLSRGQAQQEADIYIKLGVKAFEELNDPGRLAEAIMTDAVIMNAGMLQIERYKEAEKLAAQSLGENCFLMTRICNNIGISYEENRDIKQAYQYFRKWFDTCVVVFGATHAKTKKAYDVLHEPNYMREARRLGDTIPEYSFETNIDNINFLRQQMQDGGGGEVGAEAEEESSEDEDSEYSVADDDEEEAAAEDSQDDEEPEDDAPPEEAQEEPAVDEPQDPQDPIEDLVDNLVIEDE